MSTPSLLHVKHQFKLFDQSYYDLLPQEFKFSESNILFFYTYEISLQQRYNYPLLTHFRTQISDQYNDNVKCVSICKLNYDTVIPEQLLIPQKNNYKGVFMVLFGESRVIKVNVRGEAEKGTDANSKKTNVIEDGDLVYIEKNNKVSIPVIKRTKNLFDNSSIVIFFVV